MRSAVYSQDAFFDKLPKTGKLAEVLENLHSFSEEEIKKLPFDLWIRETLLKKLQGKDDVSVMAKAAEEAERMFDALKKYHDELDVFQYTGPELWVKPEHGLEISIEPNDLFAILETYRIRYTNTICHVSSTQWNTLVQNSKPIGKMTYRKYRILRQEYLEQKYKHQAVNVQQIDLTGQVNTPLTTSGVRIFKV
jgi:hypothetical protein